MFRFLTHRHAHLGGLIALIGALTTAPALGQGEPSDDELFARAEDLDATLPDIKAVQSSGALATHLESYGHLRLADDARVVDGTLFEDGVCRAVFKDGIVVPVLSGKGDVPAREVGFVFFGTGELTVRMDDRADAARFGNHMVQQAGKDANEIRPVAHGEAPYKTGFKRAFILTADRQMADIIRRLTPVGTGTVTTEMVMDDNTRRIVEEMVVTDNRGEMKAKALARQVFPKRSRVLRANGIDTVDILQFDRMVHDLLSEPWHNLRMIMEFQTDDRYFVTDSRKLIEAPDDKWMTCFRDGFDHRNSGRYSTTFAHGIDREERHQLVEFAGERFKPRPADGAPVPDQRVEPVFGKATVDLQPHKRLLFIRPKIHSEITLRATDDNVRHVVLSLPRHEAVEGKFKITKLETLAGEPVDFLELDLLQSRKVTLEPSENLQGVEQGQGFAADGENNANEQSQSLESKNGLPQELLIVLPEVLQTKDEITLVIDWEAEWNHGAWQLVQGNISGASQSNAYRPAGASTGPMSFLPELLPGAGGTPWSFEVEVGVPPRRLEHAISGDATRARVDESGWTWTTSKGRNMRKPAVAAGIWKSLREPGVAGLPAINIHLFNTYASALGEFGPEVRRILLFMRRFMKLPSFYELDVYQGRTELMEEYYKRSVNQAAAGMVGIATIRTGERTTSRSQLVEENPFRAQADLAQQMTTQVWGQVVTPASGRDEWMIQAISDAFGMFYVRAVLAEDGFNAFEGRLEWVRESLEKPRETIERRGQVMVKDRYLSLTDGGSLAVARGKVFNDYGFYVLARMLRERIGDQPFFSALDDFSTRHRGQLVTTEQLQQAFERSSGQDLDAFFSYWIRGGFVPTVELEYSLTPDANGTHTVDGCITTDIPFGTFDMPVAIRDQGGERGIGGLIDVVDGRGRFSVEGREADVALEADPYGLILSYGRRVKKVDETTCAKEKGDRWGAALSGTLIQTDDGGEIDYDRTGEGAKLPEGGDTEAIEEATGRKTPRRGN